MKVFARTRAWVVVSLLVATFGVADLADPTPAAAALGDISTAAGTTVAGFSGDGGPATAAQVNGPSGIAVADDGTVYVSDYLNFRVRKIDPGGTITTFAGTGVGGFGGDGGPATSAHLNGAVGLELDVHGNLLIADGNRIRKVDHSGTITTIAGTGPAGYSGDGGPAIDAMLNTPMGLDSDPAGNIYFAEPFGDRVRKIDADGIITTIAGTGSEGLSGDGGPATSATLYDPMGVAVGVDGQIYIADMSNNRIRRIDTTGKIITIAGATIHELVLPRDIEAAGDNNLYVTELHAVKRVSRFGSITPVAGTGVAGSTGDGGPATSATLNEPWATGINDGDLYIAEWGGHGVRRVDLPGRGQLRVTTNPAVPGEISLNGAPRDSWGLTWLDVVGGTHHVCFGPVPGFTPPPCQFVTVNEGQITNLVGNYTARGYLRVITDPAVPSAISVNSVARNDWGVWTEVEPGSQQVCFGPVEGYDPPDCQSVMVTAGGTTTVTGTFTPDPLAPGPNPATGKLRVTTDPPTGSRITSSGAWRDSWGLTWLTLWGGTEQVCFDAVLYATAPPCQLVSITAGTTTTVVGTFVHHGFLRVLTNPPVGATITIDGVPSNVWGVWTSRPPGTYEVCFEDYPGLTAPPCQDAVVTTGATTTVTGVFT